MKYGRLPRTFDPAVPSLAPLKMMKSIRLPPLLYEVHNAAKLLPPGNLGYMLNDRLGCCTASGLYHAVQVWSQNARGVALTEPDTCVLQAYEEACGYDPTNSATDAGGIEQSVLAWATNTGLPMNDGSRSKLAAFVEVDGRKPHVDVCETIQECGLLYIGFEVPRLLPEEPGAVWEDRDYGPVVGGHCVILPGFKNPDDPVFDVISWGDHYTMTAGFFERYVDESYALLSPLWFKETGTTPWGLDAATLTAIMEAVKRA